MRKGKWSLAEDAVLRDYIEKHGIGRSWQSLANNSGLNRCGRSCRSRWLNYLRPGLKIADFTEEEDMIISNLYYQKGRCWSAIAAQLPGRTDLSIKNYWNCRLSKNKMRVPRVKPDRLPPAPITPSSTEMQKPDHLPPQTRMSFSQKPSTSDGLGSKIDIDESALTTKLLTSTGGELISECLSSSTNVATESLVADASTSASAPANIERRPPEFNELVDWYVMSPRRDLAVDYLNFSSIIDDLEDINSSNLLLSDKPWW